MEGTPAADILLQYKTRSLHWRELAATVPAHANRTEWFAGPAANTQLLQLCAGRVERGRQHSQFLVAVCQSHWQLLSEELRLQAPGRLQCDRCGNEKISDQCDRVVEESGLWG